MISEEKLKVGDHVSFKETITSMRKRGHITDIEDDWILVTIKADNGQEYYTVRSRVHKLKY